MVKFNKEKIKLEKQWLDKLVAYIDFIGDDFDLIYQDLRLILRLSENIHNKTVIDPASLFYIDRITCL